MTNLTVFQGRLTANPELKQTAKGLSVISFNIANDTGSGERKHTNFIKIVAFGKTAEFISQWFFKGQLIEVIGELQTTEYDNKEGNKVKGFEILATKVEFCGEKKEQTVYDEPQPQPDFSVLPVDDDGLPF